MEYNNNHYLKSVERLRELLKSKSILELKHTKEGAIRNPRRPNDEEVISPVSDVLFKVMFETEEHKAYTSKLISAIIGLDYEYLLENMTFYKNDMSGKDIEEHQRRGDLIIKLDETLIAVEMNNVGRTGRNLEYAFRSSSIDIEGKDIGVQPIIEININNYSYREVEETISIYGFTNLDPEKKDMVLGKIFYVEIYLPKIREKCYTKLGETEKTILAMFETSKERAKVLIEGDEVLVKYRETMESAQEKDKFLEAYDHEAANFQCGRDEGYDEGHEIGYDEGREIGYDEGVKQNQLEVIKNMIDEGLGKETIARYLKMDMNELEKIILKIKEN